jgi:hypothetical protein
VDRPPLPDSLHQLGIEHGTDKWDQSRSFHDESFLHIYEHYFAPLRDQPITLLELGVKTGASLRMWKAWFPHAQIHGVDLNPDCRRHAEPRIHVHITSQDDRQALTTLAESVGGFDIVVDDCSHINVLTLASMEILLDHVKPGGFYAIEDLGMSWVDYGRRDDQDTFMDGELAMNMARGVDPNQQRAMMTRRFEQLLYDLDMRRGDLRFLHFWSMIAVAQKVFDPA